MRTANLAKYQQSVSQQQANLAAACARIAASGLGVLNGAAGAVGDLDRTEQGFFGQLGGRGLSSLAQKHMGCRRPCRVRAAGEAGVDSGIDDIGGFYEQQHKDALADPAWATRSAGWL